MAAGLGKSNDGGKRVPLEVKTGDTILFGKYSGQEIEVDGVEYLILNEEDVLAIADPGATTNTGVLKDGAARTPVNDIDPSAAR